MPNRPRATPQKPSPYGGKIVGKERANKIIKFIECLVVPSGKGAGGPFILREWQRKFIRDIYEPYDKRSGNRIVNRAILSIARKNGKTALIAALVIVHLVGPEAKPNGEIYSAANDRKQAAQVFKTAAQMVRASPELMARIKIIDSTKRMVARRSGSFYEAMSAEAGTKHGLNPTFVIFDELAQAKNRTLYDVLDTSFGAQPEPLFVVISTQSNDPKHILSTLIDDGLSAHDARIVCHLYAVPEDTPDIFDEQVWKLANPALGDFRLLRDFRSLADKAKRSPAEEPKFRNLYLNQRAEASSPFVSRTLWATCGAPVEVFDSQTPVYGGLDLSATNDLTALVLIGKIEGIWNVYPIFWLPEFGLIERARRDRVPYDIWKRDGVLLTTPGKSVDYEYVAVFLRGIFDRFNIQKIAFDRWAFKHLRPWLVKAGFGEEQIEAYFDEFGQGWQSMSPALRDLESEILNARLAHGNHPVLTMCAANAVVQTDAGGNRKLAKDKSTGRIDGMVALAMAMGVAPMQVEAPLDVECMIG